MNHLLTWLVGLVSLLAPCLCFAQYATLGANSCGLGQNNCHARENDWWSADPHYLTNERFYNSTKSATIAKAYGISLDAAKRLDSACMKCHATPTTADIAKKPVPESEYGASCESCHGAGSGYKEPHSAEKGKGYEIGARLGMTHNKEMPVRAAMCVSCHHIIDTKLLNAGHPDGKRFDYDKGLKQVAKHFRTPDAPQERTSFLAAVETVKRSAGVAPVPIAAAPSLAAATPKKNRNQTLPQTSQQPKAEPDIAGELPVDDSSTVVALDIITAELSSVTPVMPGPQFIPPPMPIMPRVKPRKPLVLPPYPSFRNMKTHADSVAILVEHLNALLKATSPEKP